MFVLGMYLMLCIYICGVNGFGRFGDLSDMTAMTMSSSSGGRGGQTNNFWTTCDYLDLTKHKYRIAKMEVDAKQIQKSGFVRYLSKKLTKMQMQVSTKGSSQMRIFGKKYMVDVLKGNLELDGLQGVHVRDFKVKSAHKLQFTLSMKNLKGHLDLDTMYQRKGWNVGNSSYCLFSTTSNWKQPCPHHSYFVENNFRVRNFEAVVSLDIKLLTCLGWFGARLFCKFMSVASYVESLFSWTFVDRLLGRIASLSISTIAVSYDELEFDLEARSNRNKQPTDSVYRAKKHLYASTMDYATYKLSIAVLAETIKEHVNDNIEAVTSARDRKLGCY